MSSPFDCWVITLKRGMFPSAPRSLADIVGGRIYATEIEAWADVPNHGLSQLAVWVWSMRIE